VKTEMRVRADRGKDDVWSVKIAGSPQRRCGLCGDGSKVGKREKEDRGEDSVLIVVNAWMHDQEVGQA
jgi:hypothetical protein